ncbi:FAD-binding oxidoreductase [Roseobacter fucihabitans]|uniref:NAD(P)/FAD-dependent oxidoreductase n=1 Tax=Roseobacter fucihabitans TaxID=1537242 RepID=UPI00292A3BE0|nr:FAD-binding oxidoreductase [Roseobacter litoralis]
MTRIFSDFVYGDGPRQRCWWSGTCYVPDRPSVVGSCRADVAIIGTGSTDLSAALHLAEAGVDVVVLDAHFPGWGASGRNGGFCFLGGGAKTDASLDVEFGRQGRLEYRAMEHAAVEFVQNLLTRLGLSVDLHSKDETELAHRPSDMALLRAKAASVEENYGVSPVLIKKSNLLENGLGGLFFWCSDDTHWVRFEPNEIPDGIGRRCREGRYHNSQLQPRAAQ